MIKQDHAFINPHSMQVNPNILSVVIKDRQTLHQVYMPFVTQCGLFIPTHQTYQLGDEVFILLVLLQEPKRMPLSGRVVWITPPNADGDRVAGIGVQINSRNATMLKQKIQAYLKNIQHLDKPTYTM